MFQGKAEESLTELNLYCRATVLMGCEEIEHGVQHDYDKLWHDKLAFLTKPALARHAYSSVAD